MSTQTAYHVATAGQTDLYAYPMANITFADWTSDRVALVETAGPGLYSAELDDDQGTDWAVFAGATAPDDWNDNVGLLSLVVPPIITPFLDEPVPKDWTLALTDRSLGNEVDRVIEAKPGELVFIGVDCRVIMATGQTNLFGFDFPEAASEGVTIVPTTNPADPQWGKAGRLVKFQAQVSEDATAGQTLYVDLTIRSSQRSKVLPRVAIVVR